MKKTKKDCKESKIRLTKSRKLKCLNCQCVARINMETTHWLIGCLLLEIADYIAPVLVL